MKNAPILAFAISLATTGCLKEDPSLPFPVDPVVLTVPVELMLVPEWNGADFDKTNVYLSAANERVLVQEVKFYLSGITTLGEDTSALLSQAELFDLTDGPSSRSMRMPIGTFSDLRFGLGLPPELNQADITEIDPFSPLGNNSGMYWTWNTMYRFLLFDGRFDTDAGGVGAPPFQFSLHTGRDACYRERTVPMPILAIQGDTVRITLNVDIARFFTDGNAVLELSQGAQSHGEVQSLPIAMELSDLAVQAINPQ